MELVLRFVVFRRISDAGLKSVGDVAEFLTDKAIQIAEDKGFDFEAEAAAFRYTFSALSEAMGSDSFRKYDAKRRRFTGGFSVSAFEAIAYGLGFNAGASDKKDAAKIKQIVQGVWQTKAFTEHSGSGLRASERVPYLIPLGRKLFAA